MQDSLESIENKNEIITEKTITNQNLYKEITVKENYQICLW